MRKKIYLVVLASILLAGCSIFKSATTEESVSVQQSRQNDIATESFESMDITIPPELFARIVGVDFNPGEATHADSSDDTPQSHQNPERTPESVHITVNRHTKTQDSSTVTTQTNRHVQTKNQTTRETRGILGIGGGFILGGFVVIIALSWVAIKYFL